MQQYKTGKWLIRQTIPLLLLLMMLLMQFIAPPALELNLQRLEGLLYDAKVQFLPPWPRNVSNIQIVDIDEASLHEIGRMPWDRNLFARLTTKLNEAGALLVVFDVLFSEPQTNAALAAVQSWPQHATLTAAQRQNLLEHATRQDADLHFASAFQSTEVVLANLLHRHGTLRSGELSVGGVRQQRPTGTTPFEPFSGFAAPIAPLTAAARGQGFMNADEDADGFIRRVSLLHQLDQQLYPSLALEAFRIYSLVEQVEPRWRQEADKAYLQGVQIGNSLIHTDQQGRILIPYRGGPKHYPYSAAADVLMDRINDLRFDQAVVFVGTSATGLADLRATPTSLTFPGVEIHATVFDGLMSPQHLPYRPDWWSGAILLQMLTVGLLCLWLFPRLGPLTSIAAAMILALLVITVNLWLWHQHVLDLPLLNLLLLVLLLSVYFISYGFAREARRRKHINNVFDQYLPPAHIERLLNDPASVSLAGEKKQLSVLFSDIRDFTGISESMSAQALKLWLNQFFSPVTKAILAHDGTIDKYVGDMVMAFWGAPLEEPAHASKSVQAAFAIIAAVEALNRQFVAQGSPIARIGIGINSGEMIVGDLGSDFRRNYTVIGDAVNLGSRLEGLTKFYGVPLLVSEFTREQATDFAYLLVDKVRVKGKLIPIRIYMPIAADTPEPQQNLYQELDLALTAYFTRDFDTALAQLTTLQIKAEQLEGSLQNEAKLQQHNLFDVRRLIAIYLQRIDAFSKHPPASDWDGSHAHNNK
ncbi:CHASE2 domain-containing protein [Rheinheimera maricola]|uniref:Adenylate/guanylate cyclase domain-containing protein n=1 Tax=Rheinheimera maricola TaxID=2793282 RepID=A0ABS7X4N4_9GAMM|nr:adenylate/guanylate cyclase domain-containing protein [Rheinheimera maricola]MBZ9610503.1 adenylate/guanylate cyclase domain-containing protein [Rheinheimera maricola]